jgi:hypothetical protein
VWAGSLQHGDRQEGPRHIQCSLRAEGPRWGSRPLPSELSPRLCVCWVLGSCGMAFSHSFKYGVLSRVYLLSLGGGALGVRSKAILPASSHLEQWPLSNKLLADRSQLLLFMLTSLAWLQALCLLCTCMPAMHVSCTGDLFLSEGCSSLSAWKCRILEMRLMSGHKSLLS